MKNLRLRFLLIGLCLSWVGPLWALEVPLRRSGDKMPGAVAVVDMDKVFQTFPDTAKARNEYYDQVAKRRAVLDDQDKKLADLRTKLAALNTLMAASTATVNAQALSTASTTTGIDVSTDSTSTTTLSGVSSSLDAWSPDVSEQDLKEMEASHAQARVDALKSLQDLADRRTLQIMGRLYDALVQLCDERGVALVIDKSQVLYGQPALDLTDALTRRIRGLPEDDDALKRR